MGVRLLNPHYSYLKGSLLERKKRSTHLRNTFFPVLRGYLGVEDMTVAKGCRLFLALTGSTELANSEGTYRFHSLTVADGGEVTSTPDVSSNSLTLDIDDVLIQGGGILHMVRMRILAGNFTVDDLGHVRGDTFDNRFVSSETWASSFSISVSRGPNEY